MFTKAFSIVAAIAAFCGVVQFADQPAFGQTSFRVGVPTYYGQPVVRGNGVVTQRVYRSSTPYSGSYVVTPQQYNSGYHIHSSPGYQGNTYQSYRPNYGNTYQSYPPNYGNTYQSYRPNYNNGPVYNNGYNGGANGYYYGTASQQRGAIVGGAIGNSIGGSRGANIGAAIGAAVQGQ